MHKKLAKEFYLRPALECATDFLGKVLVHQINGVRIAGIITDIEAYPAFVDEVHHGQKRTARSEIMWHEGGFVYVYLIYGKWYQFAIVVNKVDIPDVIFIRGAKIIEGTDQPANFPGKLCTAFSITKQHYGMDLTQNELFLEDQEIKIDKDKIKTGKRIGINDVHQGQDNKWRFHIDNIELHQKGVAFQG